MNHNPKKILFHLGHPAHFHLFRHVIQKLQRDHQVFILIKKKDILEELLRDAGLEYINILPAGRKDNKLSILYGLLAQDLAMYKFCRKAQPDVLVGTSIAVSHVGRALGIPSLNVNEDDAEAVPLYSRFAYPFATKIIAPDGCSTGKWQYKTINYPGYHELAYLHPSLFTADRAKVRNYISDDQPFFILRFAKLTAHHDFGMSGISDEIARGLIQLLSGKGKIIISSERQLISEFEPYRINIAPLDMHHLLANAELFIGDSQTMAAEAAVLGTPFIRYNDFVGKLSYLSELEEKYQLGVGIKTGNTEKLFDTVPQLLAMENRQAVFAARRQTMLNDKIESASFLTSIITNLTL